MFQEKTPEEIALLSAEELKAYNAAEKAADKDAKAKDPVKDHFEAKGKQSKENIANGGSPVIVSLVNKTLVRFTKDYGFMKKGHEQEVSDTALEIYTKEGVIEKL